MDQSEIRSLNKKEILSTKRIVLEALSTSAIQGFSGLILARLRLYKPLSPDLQSRFC